MPEQLFKLSPHRDLQCYYFQPSAIAAMSGATGGGFMLSGTWRQQWDWAVVEWNRDNTFEHPSMRYLPDGNLSGLTLSYIEQRQGCVPLESTIYPTVEWPYLRLWVPNENGEEDIYFVRLADYATPTPGSTYQNATASMTLTGSVSAGLRVGLAFTGTFASTGDLFTAQMEQHYFYVPQPGDTLSMVAAGIAAAINAGSPDIEASSNGAVVTCTYRGAGNLRDKTGSDANRIGMYGFVQAGSQTAWEESTAVFSGGRFPERYQIMLPFGSLTGVRNTPSLFFGSTVPYVPVPTSNVRKMRWTWSADLQPASFERSEFCTTISEWTVTGAGRQYLVAGPGSRRIEDDDPAVTYSSLDANGWLVEGPGNYSGSRIAWTSTQNATCTIHYAEPAPHELFVGTRLLADGAAITVRVDNEELLTYSLLVKQEDALIRLPLGTVDSGAHTVEIIHSGPDGTSRLFFDFLEIAYPSANVPDHPMQPQVALATDWDTLHSLALPPERTAWNIAQMGFRGRVNHYVGALCFYELYRPGHQYAATTATITVPSTGPTGYTEIGIGTGTDKVTIQHLNLADDTGPSIATALALRINQATAAAWASASENVLTITARTMGYEGNGLEVSSFAGPNDDVTVTFSAPSLTGAIDGADVGFDVNDPVAARLDAFTAYWRTDLSATPRLNRACRDWSLAFFRALRTFGLDCVAAFSTELAHVDPRPEAGMAQRYSDGSPCVLNTPAIQTNFSPTALAFWSEVYLEMASLQAAAGMTPYLQSGETQWWYTPKEGAGMPYYDEYTLQQFALRFGATMGVILSNDADPQLYPNEAQLLPALIGEYTAAIRYALRSVYPEARYEVLYPGDVNLPRFNAVANYPAEDWMPQNLTSLKTEGLSFARDLDASTRCMQISSDRGFSGGQRSHLVGISDARTAWKKEVDLARSQGMDSVVLFALDQFCLVGYPLPLVSEQRWSRRAA